jgi:hypothetical protein
MERSNTKVALYKVISLEAYAVTEFNGMSSSRQPLQYMKIFRPDCLLENIPLNSVTA